MIGPHGRLNIPFVNLSYLVYCFFLFYICRIDSTCDQVMSLETLNSKGGTRTIKLSADYDQAFMVIPQVLPCNLSAYTYHGDISSHEEVT